MKATRPISPPFGYFGSKHQIAARICETLPLHNCWIEAFCGSAAVTFAKVPAPIEIINDIDNQVVNFFKQLRDHSDELVRAVHLTPYSRKELSSARLTSESDNEIEKARKFLISSMMAMNGVFGRERGGFSSSPSFSRNGMEARVSRWHNLPQRILEVAERLRRVRIENKDALVLLSEYIRRPATLIYLDPPYWSERTNGYNIDVFSEQFHVELLEMANRAKCMVLVSGYSSPLYHNLLSNENGWRRKMIRTSTRDGSGKILDRIEWTWMNRQYVIAEERGRVPIRLSKQERREKKLNPIR